MESITQKGYAKINLGLDVLRRREDGYHELRMIMQTVDIYDELLIEKTDENGMVTLTANCEGLPLDENNLIVKAARIMMDTYHLSGGLRIHLTKQIPMAAGMAGGSADAAATFLGINRLFGLNLTKEELEKHGVRVGADVPYCILGGTCLAEGIGEILTPIRQLPDVPVVIVKPDFDVSTGYVYGNLHADTLKNHPDLMGNVLQNVTIAGYPQIDTIKEHMIRMGAYGSMMSGSGPSVFGLYETDQVAKEAASKLRMLYPKAFVTATRFIQVNEE